MSINLRLRRKFRFAFKFFDYPSERIEITKLRLNVEKRDPSTNERSGNIAVRATVRG